MNRRKLLFVSSALAAAAAAPPEDIAIQFHTDLEVKPGSEAALLADFDRLFLPRIRRSAGFVDARLLKFRRANVGSAPERYNYRLVQIFRSEELHEKWTVHADHKIAWHEAIEKHVRTPFVAYLYDVNAKAV